MADTASPPTPTDERSPATPARLILLRTSARDIRNRQIFASLDGVSLGDLLFNSRIEREIAPGPHYLRIHNTLFWKTIDFEASPGEVITFQTINYAGRGFLNLVLILGVAPLFLAVERVVDSDGTSST